MANTCNGSVLRNGVKYKFNLWFIWKIQHSLFGAKPLSEPMLEHCQLDSWEQISVKFKSEFYHFHSRKCFWNCCLPKWRPFCPGGDELRLTLASALQWQGSGICGRLVPCSSNPANHIEFPSPVILSYVPQQNGQCYHDDKAYGITGPLCRESTAQVLLGTEACNTRLWCFVCSVCT